MDHGIVDRLLLVITVKGALSAFSAKFISPQSKNSKVTLKGQCVKIQAMLCQRDKTLFFMLKGHSLPIILNSNCMLKQHYLQIVQKEFHVIGAHSARETKLYFYFKGALFFDNARF